MKRQKDMMVGCVHKSNSCGDMTIIGYVDSYKVLVRFDSDGTEVTSSANHIRNGRVKNPNSPSVCGVGFLGVGDHSAKKGCKAYEKWIGMLRRCYATESHPNFKTYANVNICKEWHNFQNFAEWFYSNYPKDGKSYDLDKDILSGSQKIYSPQTCQFISRLENIEASHAKEYQFKSPSGEVVDVFNLRKFCRENNLTSGEMSRVARGKAAQHKGWKRVIEVEV